MLKKRVVKISVLIGIAMLCFIGALSSLNVNAEYYQVQQGVSIHLNYDISTANDGKYANLLLNKNSDLSDYYKNYYSGGVVDFKNGYMYEADKTGVTSTVNLLESYSGVFSIIGQGFYDEYGVENSTFVADYGRLAFQFTNLEDVNQYYKFSFVQTSNHYLELNIYYYDKAEQDTSLYKITKKMSYSFTEKSAYMNNKNLPFRFEYDMATQTLNMRDEKVSQGASHDLNQLTNANLPVFENYSVDMHFENKSQKNTAKFILYELCGQIPNEVIADDYDIETANNGAYQEYYIDITSFNSDYFAKNYSGNYINFNSGRLYESSKIGTSSSIRLFNKYNGEFSIVGQGFYDSFTASSSGFTGDYSRFAVQLTNSENSQQYIKFSFTQSSSNYLELNVYYYDKDVQSTYLNKVTKNICASFTGTVAHYNNKNIPFKFKYNMNNGLLNIRDISGVIEHDLATEMFEGSNLPVFSNYSVDMLFENKSQKNTAKFIVYELCNDAFNDTANVNITNMEGNTVLQSVAVEGAKYVLPANNTKGFVGYEIDGKIYPAGYVLTVDKDITAKQMFVKPTMVNGASIRINVSQDYVGGIRFLINIEDNVMNAFGDNAKMYGVLIYTDSIVGDFDLDEAGSQCKVLSNYYCEEGVRGYFITLSNINSNHYKTSYSARAYVEVTLYNGDTVKVATDYSDINNARSPYQVAQKAEEDGITGTMIDTYLGRISN
ncbi:MAG: hypothetical protein E7373_00830 [Clostridiales bacterium]|nr:hypothetical protein [Clostridiales bacterium]